MAVASLCLLGVFGTVTATHRIYLERREVTNVNATDVMLDIRSRREKYHASALQSSWLPIGAPVDLMSDEQATLKSQSLVVAWKSRTKALNPHVLACFSTKFLLAGSSQQNDAHQGVDRVALVEAVTCKCPRKHLKNCHKGRAQEGTITLWESDTGEWQSSRTLRCSHSEPVVALLDDFVAVTGRDCAQILRIQDGSTAFWLAHDSICTLGTITTERQVLCTGSYDGTVRVWPVWEYPVVFPAQRDSQVNVLLGVSTDRLFVGTSNGGHLWHVPSATCLASFSTPDPDSYDPDCGDWFSAADVLQAEYFCAGGRNGVLSVWSIHGQIVATDESAHCGQWILAIRSMGVGRFCSAAQDAIFVWQWSNSNELLKHTKTFWGHTGVISRLAWVPDNTLVSTAQNGEMIFWDLCSMREKSFHQLQGAAAGLTTVHSEVRCFLLDGCFADNHAECGIPWADLVAGLPSNTPAQMALLRFACSLMAEGRSGGSGSRESDRDLEQLLLKVLGKLQLPLHIEAVFEMGSSSRSTHVTAPHLLHAPADFDFGIRMEPGHVEPDLIFSALQSEVQRVLIPTLSRGYLHVDQCSNGHTLQKESRAVPCVCDRCHGTVELLSETYWCSICDYDVCISCMETPEGDTESCCNWECEVARFGVKLTRHISRSIACSIDLVPFQRVGEGDFPQLKLFDRENLQWVSNNPPLFTHQFNLFAQKDLFLPLVAILMKYWNHIQSRDDEGKAPLKGMHIECLLLQAKVAGGSKTENFAEAVASGFQYCADHVLDPDVQPPGGSVYVGPSYIPEGRRQYVQRLLRSAASLAKFAFEREASGGDTAAFVMNQSTGAWSQLLCEGRWQDDGHAQLMRNPFLETEAAFASLL